MPKIIVVYDPQKGIALADGRISNYVDQALKVIPDLSSGTPYRIFVGTESLVNAFRIALKQGRVSTEDIGFEFEGKPVPHTPQGRFTDWPAGFCALMDMQLTELVEV